MNKKRGMVPITSTTILLAVIVTCSLILGLWAGWIIETEKRRIEYLEPMSSIKTYANQFEIGVRNHGADVSKIIMIFFNQVPTKIYDAVNDAGEQRIYWENGKPYVIVNPGETVWIRGFSPKKLIERTIYAVKIVTIKGNWFQYPLQARLAPLNATILAINTGLKVPGDPSKRIILFAPILQNNRGAEMKVYKITVYDSNFEHVVFTMNFTPPKILSPGEVWRPKTWRDLMKAGLKPGDYYVRVDFEVMNQSDYMLGMMTVSNDVIKAYVLKIEKHGGINEKYPSWTVDLDYMINQVKKLMDVEFIDSMKRYMWIIEGTEKLPEPFILINLHSEPVPLPWPEIPELINETERKVYWHLWFEKIGKFIESNKMIWVNPSGYPFWGVANKPIAQKYGLDWTTLWGCAINCRSLCGYSYGYCWSGWGNCLSCNQDGGGKYGGATNLWKSYSSSPNPFTGAYFGGAYCGSNPSNPEIHYYDVTYNGFPVVTGGLGQHCTWTWWYGIDALNPVKEFNEFFADFGLSLPDHTTGWDVPDVSDFSNVIKYYETSWANPQGKKVPTVYAIEQGEGYLLVVGLPPDATALSVDMSIYLSVHVYLFKILLPSHGLA